MKIALLILSILILGAGCSAGSLGSVKESIVKGAQSVKGYARNLTDEQKQAIDEWLSSNKLNKYGDSLDTLYAGGTPLFNEATGESIDRFEYLFAKFPDLKKVISYQLKKKYN